MFVYIYLYILFNLMNLIYSQLTESKDSPGGLQVIKWLFLPSSDFLARKLSLAVLNSHLK